MNPSSDRLQLAVFSFFFRSSVRNAFRMALTEYSGNDSIIAPQFKTWFYIYRNNKAEEEFKRTLADDYLVEIKEIERIDFDFDSPRTAEQKSEGDHQNLPTNSKDVLQFDDLKNTEPKDDKGTIDGFETLKLVDDSSDAVEQAIADYDQLIKEEKGKVSKYDKHVDESQYAEVQEIKKEETEKNDVSEKEHLKKKLEKEEGPEKVTLPLKKFSDESGEMMEAQENRHFVSRVRKVCPSTNSFQFHQKTFRISVWPRSTASSRRRCYLGA